MVILRLCVACADGKHFGCGQYSIARRSGSLYRPFSTISTTRKAMAPVARRAPAQRPINDEQGQPVHRRPCEVFGARAAFGGQYAGSGIRSSARLSNWNGFRPLLPALRGSASFLLHRAPQGCAKEAGFRLRKPQITHADGA